MPAPIAIAVVSWNTRDLLVNCLGSIEPEVQDGRAEAWVVDNASEDGSADLVRRRFGWAHLIASESNLGFGQAVNLVAERTANPWIAPANTDVELVPGALERLLEAGDHRPRAGALAPQLLLPDGSTEHSVYRFPTFTFGMLFNSGVYRLSPRLADRLCLEGRWDPERPRQVDWAIAAFLLVRRAAWEDCGGFNTEQWMYAEDLDLGWRLARSGWTTRYVPEAKVRHRSGAATQLAWGSETAPRWMASTYAWMLRTRGIPITRAVATVNIAGALLRWALFAVAAAIRPHPWRERRNAMRVWVGLHRIGLRSRRRLAQHR